MNSQMISIAGLGIFATTIVFIGLLANIFMIVSRKIEEKMALKKQVIVKRSR